MDAAVKVVALAVALQLESDHPFSLADVDVSGIQVQSMGVITSRMPWRLILNGIAARQGIDAQRILEAKSKGRKLRLVGGAERVCLTTLELSTVAAC